MGLIVFLKNDCLRAKNAKEFCIADEFDQKVFDSMVQDGIMVVKKADPSCIPKGVDHVEIEGVTFFRKNSPLQLSWLKDDGSIQFDDSKDPLYRRIEVQVDHPRIISSIIRNTNTKKQENYVEYGVMVGRCLEQIAPHVNIAYSVDMGEYQPKAKNIQFYSMTTDEFSEKKLPTLTFNYAFVDADHTSKQALIDFENVYKYIKTGGYIFLHDTYPYSQQYLQPKFCNDCYKTPLEIRKRYPNIEMLTLPLNPGLTIIRKT